MCGVLLQIHVVYMVVYTVYVLPQSVDVYTVYVLPQSRLLVDVYSTNSTGASSCRSLPTSDLFGLFLIWPCLVLAFVAYYTVCSSPVR